MFPGSLLAFADDARFWIEWLAAYSADRNRVAHVWNHTKYGDLANHVPRAPPDVEVEAEMSLDGLRTKRDLPRSCSRGGRLEF